VNAGLSALIQKLVERLGVLAERYEKTLGDLEGQVEALSAKVVEHLSAMGTGLRKSRSVCAVTRG
jgi:type I restriction enzyme M protein